MPLFCRLRERGCIFFPFFLVFPRDGQNANDQIIKIDDTESVLYRYHRLRSCASPVKGLTADILVRIAIEKNMRKSP